ncbi:MAG: HEAT repeat domain-containing protein [Planctomycetes bacterium]|nr:HEAT repeat domain-containing protein [Planctomycetota bacterium]
MIPGLLPFLAGIFLIAAGDAIAPSSQATTAPQAESATAKQDTAKSDQVDKEAKPEAPAEPPHDPEGVKPPEGFEWKLWAKEPLVADPVAFAVLNDNSLMVVESSRQDRGVEDNRYSSWWLLDDLRAKTVEERLAYYKKWEGKRKNGMEWYTEYADRVKHVTDAAGKGEADTAVNFSGELNEPLDGTAAGALQVGDSIFVTCIPNLWRFQDKDGDGVAEVREKMFTGFGVKTSLRGHDMHGLALGMDGRLYWSIGDRGYSVRSKEGELFEDAGRGAVFRCELDGSNLEVFFRGLRNPQELAFNDLGDLFTGDNNSDAGDKARIQYLPDGGDAGWEMHYQTLEGANQRGPWSQEHVWYTFDPTDLVQPAWNTPPIAHLTSGPSGLVAYPGVGFPEKYAGEMFLCDFLGGDAYSQIWSFKLEPKGAGYEMKDEEIFLKEVLPTDVDFGTDGSMWVTDWFDGWTSDGTGRLYRVWQPEELAKAAAAGGAEILKNGFRKANTGDLLGWLDHPDRRVRHGAHLELAARGSASIDSLAALAHSFDTPARARLHALWSLGVMARRLGGTPAGNKACDELIELAADPDPELKAQAARALGDSHCGKAVDVVRALTLDENPRARAYACAALGRLKDKEGVANLNAVLWENDNQDPWLRQAAATALARIGDRAKLEVMAADQFAQVRLGALLALRQMRDPAISRLLFDADATIALEAARAIYDLKIDSQMTILAGLGDRFCDRAGGSQSGVGVFTQQDPRTLPLLRRIIAANRLLTDPEAVNRLAELSQSSLISPEARMLAFESLAEWAEPGPREPVHGRVIDLAVEARDREAWKRALALALPNLASNSPDEALRGKARELAGKSGVALDSAATLRTALDANANPRERAGCLRQLAQDHDPELAGAIDAALASNSPLLRSAARSVLAKEAPSKAIPLLQKAAAAGEIQEQQAAIVALASLTDEAAANALKPLAKQLALGTLPPSIQLEMIEACSARPEPEFAQSLSEWKSKFAAPDPFPIFSACVEGGSAEIGQRIVSSNSASQCLRCHSIAGGGGHAGPSLEGVAARYDRRGLLESLVTPNAKLAPGFGPISAMPTMTTLLSPREMRDVVAYLATLKPAAVP